MNRKCTIDLTCFPSINMVETGNRIKELMFKNGITVRDLQAVMGFSTPQAIYKWLRGETLPQLDNLVILSAVFGVGIDDIIVIDRIDYSAKSA